MADGQTCYLHGIGVAVPDHALGPQESAELFKQAYKSPRTGRLLRRIIRLTGIQKRHLVVLDDQLGKDGNEPFYRPVQEQPHGPGMGVRTALFEKASGPLVRQALETFSGESLARVRTLVTASCTHASAPGLEQPVFLHTPVPRSVDRWNLGFMGCSAGLAAMRLIQQSTPSRDSLIVACELSSLHFQYHESLDQMTANVLFSDGTAAMMLSPTPSAVRVVDCRCAAVPESADQMVWFAGDHGLRLKLSQELPDTIAAVLPGVVEPFLADNGLSRSAVDHWLVHPGGPQILDCVASCLELPDDALTISRGVLREYGNMSSPTIFFIMRELIESKVDGTCLAMAFGPGLTIELVLMRIDRSGA